MEAGRNLLASRLASSLKEHQKYGGVVPEIASRAHVELLTSELEALFSAGKAGPGSVDRVAVTYGPGLPGCLLAGVAAAKALSLAWRRDLVAVNHLHAHLYAALMAPAPAFGPEGRSPSEIASGGQGGAEAEPPEAFLDERMIGLVISGGHTALVRMDGISRYTLLGQTRDDAVGEAFDKVAKLLGLGFPGGPEIERAARGGDPAAFRFTVPRMKSGNPYEFSLSGMKTAVLYKVREYQKTAGREQGTVRQGPLSTVPCPLSPGFVADMAASFQAAIVEEVVQKAVSACRNSGIVHLAAGGGVVANRRLRERLDEACRQMGIRLRVPSPVLCTDNGAMVAGLGHHLKPVRSGELTAVPELGIG